MARQHNTNRDGGAWTAAEIKAVWEKGRIVESYNKDNYRVDKCSHFMQFSEHGNRNSQYGWEIDHTVAVANGGTDDQSNLQPLYWGNNASKGDKLNWQCGQ